MRELVVAADDRTGALEVAGECAERGAGTVLVRLLNGAAPAGARDLRVEVLDLGSRHLEPREAAARAKAADAVPGRARAHKIDSLLRGNWAVELVARHRAGRRVLVVPALPGMDRICRDGVVWHGGRPLGEMPADVRGGALSSRPAAHLVAAGANGVAELRSAADVTSWRSGFAVVDAATPADLDAIGGAWRELAGDVVLAGTGAAIGAAVGPGATPVRLAPVGGGILVVCGSLHHAARRQVEHLQRRALEAVTIVASPDPVARPVPERDAMAVAARLATEARRVMDAHPPGAVVVIGGDTAGAVLGDEPRVVGGTVAPGAPWSRGIDREGPVVVTRAGSFGADDALVELVGRLRGRPSIRGSTVPPSGTDLPQMS